MAVRSTVMLEIVEHLIQSFVPHVSLRLVSNDVGSAPTPTAHCGECGEHETFGLGDWDQFENEVVAFAKKHAHGENSVEAHG